MISSTLLLHSRTVDCWHNSPIVLHIWTFHTFPYCRSHDRPWHCSVCQGQCHNQGWDTQLKRLSSQSYKQCWSLVCRLLCTGEYFKELESLDMDNVICGYTDYKLKQDEEAALVVVWIKYLFSILILTALLVKLKRHGTVHDGLV